MRAIVLFIVSFLLMYVDFKFADFSPFFINDLEIHLVPRALLMFILLVSIYTSPALSIFLAALFGILLDLYAGSVYGIHAFGMVAFVLFMHTAFRVFYKDFVAMAFVLLFLTFLYDAYTYFIHALLDLIHLPLFDYIALRAVPSLLVNALLYIIIFVLALKTSKIRQEVLPKD